MHLDVKKYIEFYNRTPPGRILRRVLQRKLAKIWSPGRQSVVVGYGYATPILSQYLQQSHVLALMPAEQGVVSWPHRSTNCAVLSLPLQWPLGAGQVDHLLVLHGFGTGEHPERLLKECFRVLVEDGQAIFIVPNKTSAWAQTKCSPFGAERAFWGHALDILLEQNGFELIARHGILPFFPAHKSGFSRFFRRFKLFNHELSYGTPPGLWLVHVRRQALALHPPTRQPQQTKNLSTILPKPKPSPALNRQRKTYA